MAKVQIKSEKLTPLGGIFSIMEQFDALLSKTIDSTLGVRSKLYGYQYSENTVFLLMTALIRNFYKAIMQRLEVKKFGLRINSRIKTKLLRFQSVWFFVIENPPSI